MAAIPVGEVVAAGLTNPTLQAAAAGDTIKVQPTGTTTMRVKNAAGASMTVTIAAERPCSAGSLHNVGPITIPATTGDVLIPIPQRCRGANGNAAVTYSSTTTVTVSATHQEA